MTPFVGVDAYKLESDGFTENSQGLNGEPGILGLTFKSDSVTSVTSSLGIQFDTQYVLAYDRVLTRSCASPGCMNMIPSAASNRF